MAGKCSLCGGELELLDIERDGSEIWVCKNDCAMTEEKAALIYEEIQAEIQAEAAPAKTSHCWTTNCPGTIVRTEEASDGDYGHFCPECGRSLRHHSEYGEGGPRDRALRTASRISSQSKE